MLRNSSIGTLYIACFVFTHTKKLLRTFGLHGALYMALVATDRLHLLQQVLWQHLFERR